MIKYTVLTESYEFDPVKHNPEQAYWADDNHGGEIVAVCDTLAEARKVLATVPVETVDLGYRCSRATVAFIEESDYKLNDDGEWEFVEGSSIWDFTFA